jgi:hypothetical protein
MEEERMSFRKPLSKLGLVLLAAGCTTIGAAPDSPPAAVPSVCDANAASWAIGEDAGSDVLDRAASAAGARLLRVIRPGEVVTMEFNAERLTFDVDGSGRISGIRCG